MSKTLITGGRVLPLDGTTTPREALVVDDGRIAATGSASDMAALAGRGAERLDVKGATVMPGLIDTHPHVLHFGAVMGSLVDITDTRNHDDIVERIRARAAETPAGEWIMTTPVGEPHYFIRRSYRDLEERRLPDRHTLDRATTDHPVLIQAWAPVTPNVCAFNSAGLRAVGLSSFIPDQVCNVTLEKDEHGVLTGILRGPVTNYYTYDPFWGQILSKLPKLEPASAMKGTLAEMARYTRQGVTTVYEGHAMEPVHIFAYQLMRADNALTFRVLATVDVESCVFYPFEPLSLAEFSESLPRGAALTDTSDDMLRVNGLTMSPGGPCWPGFLSMYDPFEDPYGKPTRGVRFLSLEKEEVFVRFCAANGIRANMCMGSYREHDEFLAIAERVVAEHDFRERRWILQHAILITPEQARRYKALGFQITTSVGFAWGKGDLYGRRVGRHVWRDLIPLKRLLRAGLDVCCGSDWGPKNVFQQIQLAETHEFAGSGHRNATPDHAVTREEAVAMWTRDAARVLGWEGVGSLAAGNHADVIVVDRDPLTCSLEALSGTKILRTILGGRTVFDSGEL